MALVSLKYPTIIPSTLFVTLLDNLGLFVDIF